MTNWPGPLPPEGELGPWLARLTPESAAFAGTSRAAIFLLALHQRDRETFYADLCQALLPPDLRATSVLDIGCGAGNLSLELAARLGAPVTGIDTDPYLLLWAQRATRGAGFEFPVRIDAARFGVARMAPLAAHAPPSFILGSVFHPPFAAASFDLVGVVNLLDSLADPAAALGQAVALLKPGGHLLFASPDSWNLRTTPRARWRTTPAEWDALFAAAGLQTLRSVDDLEWRLKDSPRLHHIYRVHGRLLRKAR